MAIDCREAGRPARGASALTLLAGAAAAWFVPFFFYTPYDYGRWLGPWYQHILATGRLAAFEQPFGNYTPPYLYLLSATTLLDGAVPPLVAIKLLSTLGACWLAYAIARLLDAVGSPLSVRAALWSLLLPTVLVNVPFLAQADPFWVAPAILAVAAAVRGNMLAMTVWAAVAFAFKAQAIFIAPFVMAMLVRGRAPAPYWLIPLPVYAAAMAPAWLMGWPAHDLATVYLRQAAWVPADGIPFVSNASNLWVIFKSVSLETAIANFWIGYAAAAAVTTAYVWQIGRRDLSPSGTIAAAALSAAMLPWVLPGMHERFFALAEMLTFALAFARRDRASIMAAGLMQLALLLAMIGWQAGRPGLAVAGCFAVAAALVLLVDRVKTRHGRAAPSLPASGSAAVRSSLPG